MKLTSQLLRKIIKEEVQFLREQESVQDTVTTALDASLADWQGIHGPQNLRAILNAVAQWHAKKVKEIPSNKAIMMSPEDVAAMKTKYGIT
jgi:hypothetical protein